MGKEKTNAKETTKETLPKNKSLTFSVDVPETEYVQCFICGHTNPPGTGLCQMCSAYLFIKK